MRRLDLIGVEWSLLVESEGLWVGRCVGGLRES